MATKPGGKRPTKATTKRAKRGQRRAPEPAVAYPASDIVAVEPERPGGRPSDYRPEYAEQAERFARLGATDAELAEHFGCAVSTLYEWKTRFPEFSEAIKRGKKPADADVAHALFNRATGAEWVEQQAVKLKTVTYAGGKRVKEEERVEVVDVVRRAPPDTTAGIFILKNRASRNWRDKHEVVTERRHVIVMDMTVSEAGEQALDDPKRIAQLEGRILAEPADGEADE